MVELLLPVLRAMFDWPEHSHTSPTTTSVSVSVGLAVHSVAVRLVPSARAASGGRTARHVPSAPAVALAVAPSTPRSSTATSAPGGAYPHTLAREGARCSTMWSEYALSKVLQNSQRQ